ncbi:flagellar biosynthesis repressor FlbT [Pararhizobium sp. IMCC21322]|uniref:flagellar biosynthesis repressor FlbT n=1 Tax=Pararhizobium sp. IMCC21322 TaxID=3067903 RepID=UPI00274139AF|nr:flagellar biosynthesis repressor FlbT [Pararhizobium sp. IMCC21322]
MSLRVELKPNEKMIVGQTVITNGDQRTKLTIDGNTPILRAKDILLPEQADTPAKCVALVVQTMYLSDTPEQHHSDYFKLINEIVAAAPSTIVHIEAINNLILTNELYKALRATKALIAYEGELLAHATGGANLSEDTTDNN